MNMYFFVVFAVIIFSLFSPVTSQNGFVVWTEGSGCDKELQFNKLTNGIVGPKQTAVIKGVAADVWVQISYDGEWIAFGRFNDKFTSRYGHCDSYAFDKTDIFIAKIAHGKNLPAEAIRVDHGYWPSWAMDENAKNPSKPKVLYYTRYSDRSIRKAVINPDGTIANKDIKHSETPVKVTDTKAQIQGSPNGRYIAFQPDSIRVYDNDQKKNVPGAGGKGFQPCWGPRSNYLMYGTKVCRIEDGQTTMEAKYSGIGTHQGASNDVNYDRDTLYISSSKVYSANSSYIQFTPVDISNGGWNVGHSTKVGIHGTFSDIHIFFEALELRAPSKPLISSKTLITPMSNGVTSVIVPFNGPHAVQVISMNGTMLHEFKGTSETKYTLSANNAAGVYLVRISGNNRVFFRRLCLGTR